MHLPFLKIQKRQNNYFVDGETHCQLGSRFTTPDKSQPQGIFAEWQWQDNILQANVDLFGFYNLFYYATDQEIIISPSLIQIIAQGAPRDIDQRMLNLFFRIGYCVDENTPFKHIKVLPPNGHLTWQNGQLSVIGGKQLYAEQPISESQAVDGFIDLFRQAMQRHLNAFEGDVILPLSGGRDSRHILLELNHLNRLPKRCVTLNANPTGLDSESQIALQNSQEFNLPHDILSNGGSRFQELYRLFLITHLCADEHAHLLQLRDYFYQQQGVVVDGIAGDVLSRNRKRDKKLHDAYRRQDYETVALSILQSHCDVLHFNVEEFLQPYPQFAFDDAVAYLVEVLKQFDDAAHPLTAYQFWNRTRREISLSPMNVLDSAQDMLLPFLDHDLAAFLFSLPYEATGERGFHDRVIEKSYPDYAHIPYSDSLQVPMGRHTWTRRIKTMTDGLTTVAKLRHNHRDVLKELQAQMTVMKNEKQRWMNVYRQYMLCFEWVQEPDFAQHYINIMSEMESTFKQD